MLKSKRHLLMMLGAGLSLATGSLPLLAETSTPMSPEPAPAVREQMWLQDPWSGDTRLTWVEQPDKSLWNLKRVNEHAESLKVNTRPPLAVLTIESLGLQAPVYNGTDELMLNKGLGRIRGMARPNEAGNLGISGHRDGYFRVLKDISLGDKIMVRTAGKVDVYTVEETFVVNKTDFSPLETTEEHELTLVTCYPFYFVGNAPERFIIKARAAVEEE